MNDEHFTRQKEHAREIYNSQKSIFNPYFNKDVLLNSKGFHHLQNSQGRIRNKNEQLFKFRFLKLGFEVLKTSSTIQEYRESSFYDYQKKVSKPAQFWGMIAIVGDKKLRIRVVVRKIGEGELHFWSVMPYTKIKNGRQKIYDEGLENW